MIEFKVKSGCKPVYNTFDTSKDEILLVKTDDWHVISNDEVLRIIKHIFKNEERIYPRDKGCLGSAMFMAEIMRLYNEDS